MIQQNDDFTQRDSLIGDLHYTCRTLSEESLHYVLNVAKSLSDGLVDQTHTRLKRVMGCTIDQNGIATVTMAWTMDGEPFIESTYRRDLNGKWYNASNPNDHVVCEILESAYREKLSETEAVFSN